MELDGDSSFIVFGDVNPEDAAKDKLEHYMYMGLCESSAYSVLLGLLASK